MNNSQTYDYPFPNSKAIFWFYFSPMFVFFVIFLIAFRNEIFVEEANQQVLINLLCIFILSTIIMPILAYIFANSFPAIRVKTDGIEIRIYSPIRTQWLYLQWNEIDRIEEFTYPLQRLLYQNKRWLFIISKQLPNLYFILSILYKHTPKRGFIITPKIKKYYELINLINDNYRKRRQQSKN